MRIALIDLGAAPIPALQELLIKHELVVVDGQVAADVLRGQGDYNGVLAIGSYGARTADTDSAIDIHRLVEAARSSEMPLVGVGKGFELVCASNGIDLAAIAERDVAADKVVPTNDGAKIFQGSDPMLVRQTERWWVNELPKSLQVLARSDSGIEAVRHKQRLMVAIQLELEDFVYASDGKLVFKNLLGLFGRV